MKAASVFRPAPLFLFHEIVTDVHVLAMYRFSIE